MNDSAHSRLGYSSSWAPFVLVGEGGVDSGAARWAMVAALVATAKLIDVGPFAYLRDVLERMPNGHPTSRLDEKPWNWALLRAAA